jgi:oxygen-independent coproporphyrinogen-3 oxidase
MRKCPYCDFNSHPLAGEGVPEARFVDAVLADLAADASLAQGRAVETVYLGGGTPSLLSPEAVARLLAGVAGRLPLAADAEVTLEANPGTVDRGRLADLAAAGVSRLSIGVQSFDDALLARIGRIHTGAQAVTAVEAAGVAGFRRVNADLMYGLPGQRAAQALADLDRVLGLGVGHVSWYQLTVEPGTAFHHDPPRLPDEAEVEQMEARGRARLAAGGLERYEVSAFARDRERCRHNLNYWRFGDYLGVGPGAHAKVTVGDAGVVTRRVKRRHPRDYLSAAEAGAFCAEERRLGPDDLIEEFLLNALRLVEGVPASLLPERTGLHPHAIAPALEAARRRGLLSDDLERLQATPRGLQYLNDLLVLLTTPIGGRRHGTRGLDGKWPRNPRDPRAGREMATGPTGSRGGTGNGHGTHGIHGRDGKSPGVNTD